MLKSVRIESKSEMCPYLNVYVQYVILMQIESLILSFILTCNIVQIWKYETIYMTQFVWNVG